MKATPFTRHLESLLSAHYAEEVKITGAEMAHGGSINECYQLITNRGDFFLKRNDAVEFPGMFTEEAKGLHALRESTSLKVPSVIAQGNFKSHSFLILEHLEKSAVTNAHWEKLGEGLAELHRNCDEKYGWTSNNYIGSLEQKNQNTTSWPQFMVQQRIEPMALKALSEKRIDRKLYERIQLLYPKLEHLFPVEIPTLLHGDLWSGNFMPLSEGQCALYDPAVYYGHREMDLAMTRLFGGFHQRFYDAYNHSHPLETGWKDRVEIAQLYPLLVHVNLFGGGYIHQVELILKKWC